MSFETEGQSIGEEAVVERMIERIDRSISLDMADEQRRNATEFLTYLIDSGVTDEDDLLELTLLASGKRYDPQDGSFS